MLEEERELASELELIGVDEVDEEEEEEEVEEVEEEEEEDGVGGGANNCTIESGNLLRDARS